MRWVLKITRIQKGLSPEVWWLCDGPADIAGRTGSWSDVPAVAGVGAFNNAMNRRVEHPDPWAHWDVHIEEVP